MHSNKWYRTVVLCGALGFWPTMQLLASDWRVEGAILTPSGIVANGTLSIHDDTIKSITPASSDENATKVPGIIIPGFIDLHDHLTWNVLPRWLPARHFGTRYEWQDDPEYDRLLVAPHSAVMASAACEVEIYSEIKALAGGSTSVLGGLLKDPGHPDNAVCLSGLARNLDTDSGLQHVPAAPQAVCPTDSDTDRNLLDVVDNEVFPLEVGRNRFDYLLCQLGAGALRSLVVHLSEGAPGNPNARREFTMLSKEMLIDRRGNPTSRAGLNVIHGTALRDRDFIAMKNSNVGLVWSARSNDELYGATTNISSAIRAGVVIAIAPDWSPSGSAGMLQELAYVSRRYPSFEASDLISMATENPAQMARISDQVGTLEPGKKADFVILNVNIDVNSANPLTPVTTSTPAAISLVVVGGEPIYGDRNLLSALLPQGTQIDSLDVCGVQKAVNLKHSGAGARKETLADVTRKINDALARTGEAIPPIECN